MRSTARFSTVDSLVTTHHQQHQRLSDVYRKAVTLLQSSPLSVLTEIAEGGEVSLLQRIHLWFKKREIDFFFSALQLLKPHNYFISGASEVYTLKWRQ
ncbi:unnamed protein product [Calypogeia fissa]